MLKFFVAGITFYGMSTFEGPMLSVKAVNALTHYTDWTIAHVHAGRPRLERVHDLRDVLLARAALFQTKLYSKRLAETHFWIGAVGILTYAISLYAAGVFRRAWMWGYIDEDRPARSTPTSSRPRRRSSSRCTGCACCTSPGPVIGCWNVFMTWQSRPAEYEVPVTRPPR